MPAKKRKFKQAYILCLMFVGLIGSIAATYAYMNVSHPDGVTCARDRLASFGWTDRRMPLAEMAAIATWQREAEERKSGYGNWHLAYKRSMKCTRFKNSDHFQCIVSALPCKYAQS